MTIESAGCSYLELQNVYAGVTGVPGVPVMTKTEQELQDNKTKRLGLPLLQGRHFSLLYRNMKVCPRVHISSFPVGTGV
jgi:hypothetical protein